MASSSASTSGTNKYSKHSDRMAKLKELHLRRVSTSCLSLAQFLYFAQRISILKLPCQFHHALPRRVIYFLFL